MFDVKSLGFKLPRYLKINHLYIRISYFKANLLSNFVSSTIKSVIKYS